MNRQGFIASAKLNVAGNNAMVNRAVVQPKTRSEFPSFHISATRQVPDTNIVR
jgi:hypothetical protein